MPTHWNRPTSPRAAQRPLYKGLRLELFQWYARHQRRSIRSLSRPSSKEINMRYQPTIEGNEWVTVTTQGNGNLGIDNQRKFKDGVLMLETAIDEWATPALVHMVITGASLDAYSLFLHKLKRSLDDAGVPYKYRGCTEVSTRKGQHQHYMIVVDSSCPASLFDMDDEQSILSTACSWTQRAAPSFKVWVAEPKHHGVGGIPLSVATLQDAADYLSYIFKVRSKEPGHRYLSSRSARRGCPADRPTRLVKPNHLCQIEF